VEEEDVDNSEEGKETEVEDFKYFRIEQLLERRPFLVSDVQLEQNPNDVSEWLNRIQLCDTIKDTNS
jgi:pre-mRNA-splicing factor SYF1